MARNKVRKKVKKAKKKAATQASKKKVPQTVYYDLIGNRTWDIHGSDEGVFEHFKYGRSTILLIAHKSEEYDFKLLWEAAFSMSRCEVPINSFLSKSVAILYTESHLNESQKDMLREDLQGIYDLYNYGNKPVWSEFIINGKPIRKWLYTPGLKRKYRDFLNNSVTFTNDWDMSQDEVLLFNGFDYKDLLPVAIVDKNHAQENFESFCNSLESLLSFLPFKKYEKGNITIFYITRDVFESIPDDKISETQDKMSDLYERVYNLT